MAEPQDIPTGQTLCLNHGVVDAVPQMAMRVWAALQSIDSGLPTIALEGVGECNGDRLHLVWVAQEHGRFFAIDAHERVTGERWQFALCPAPDGECVSIWRRIWRSADQVIQNEPHRCAMAHLWLTVFKGVETHPIQPKREPHFIALIATAISHTGLSSIKDDSAEVAALRAELHYWKDLAKTQSKLLKAKPEAHPQRHDLQVAAEPAPSQPKRNFALDELAEWAALNSERIVIVPRAIAAARRSNYQNPEFVYECLELLAEDYTLTKLGELDRNAFKDKAQLMGLSFGGSVDPSVAASRGDEYFIRWGGRRRFLDQHIGKGSMHDPRYTMRIYFTWCEDLNLVVVGWLPSHLGTGRT